MGGVARSTAQGIQFSSLSVSDESLSCPLELVKRSESARRKLKSNTSLLSMVRFDLVKLDISPITSSCDCMYSMWVWYRWEKSYT